MAYRADLVALTDIRKARERLTGLVARTPLYYDPALSRLFRTQVYLKLESYQPIRVFKIRGALNKILSLTEEEKLRGVITASSGNHGLAVAYGARKFGLKATICVPKLANPDKLASIESYGAKIVKYGKAYDDAYRKALEIQRRDGGTFIHAFDDPVVISGQGTIGAEVMEDLPDVDTLIVPVGGGGLISGIATAVRGMRPQARVIGVEPKNVPSMFDSLRLGRPIELKEASTIADGLLAKKPGNLTFQIVKKYVEKILLVTEEQLKAGIVTLLKASHVLAEPAGAAALAGLLYKYKPRTSEKIVLIVSGGNISVDLLSELLSNSR